MPERWPHTAAVLAGGASTRMGRPKEPLALADGRSMIETVAAVLADVARDVVVLGATAALPSRPHLDDLRPGQGPLGGIEALLASGRDTEYLVCPCDLPRVSAELLLALLRPTEAVVTVFRVAGEDRFRPLPARFSVSALGAVREALDRERRAVFRVIELLGPEIVDVPESAADQLANVNTPSDFDAL